jgi:hypothetical protein
LVYYNYIYLNNSLLTIINITFIGKNLFIFIKFLNLIFILFFKDRFKWLKEKLALIITAILVECESIIEFLKVKFYKEEEIYNQEFN